MAAQTLKLTEEKNIPQGFQLLLIVSSLNDYRLTFFINSKVGLRLKKLDDIPFVTKKESKTFFPWFFYKNEITDTKYYLIANKYKTTWLFSSLKKIDYLFFIKNPVSTEKVNELTTVIRKIGGIVTVMNYDLNNLKEIEAFLDELEMQELEQVILPAKKPTYRELKRKRAT